jgi:hypothetical protein
MKNIFQFVRCNGFLFGLFCLFTTINTLHAQWVQTNEPYGGSVPALAVSPNGTGGTNLFAGTIGGVFLSTDNGTSWTAVNNGLPKYPYDTSLYDLVYALVVSPNETGGTNLFAGTEYGGVFLSTNNGTSWTAANNGLPKNPDVTSFYVSVFAFAVSPNGTGGTNLFAGTYYSGVFLSTDNGTSWTAVNTGLPNTSVLSLAVSPNGTGGTNLFAGTWGGVFLSTNSGTSWSAVGLTNTRVSSLAVSPNGTGGTNLFAGTWDGVFLSTNNGTSWTAVNTGLRNTYVWSLAVSPNGTGGTNLFAGTWGWGGGVFLSTNNGTNWTSTGLTNTYVRSLAVSPNGAGGINLFAGTYYGGVFLSTNNGISWTSVNNGLPQPYADVMPFVVSFLTVSPNGTGGTNLFAVTDGGVFLSTNNGTSWSAVNYGLTQFDGVGTNTLVRSLAVSDTNLFAGTDNGVFLSSNNGTSWSAAGLRKTNILSLAVSPADGGTGGTNLFAATYYGVFLSTNNGTSWTAVNAGLTSTPVRPLAVYSNGTGGSNLFAGTDGGGVFLSTNNGTSWSAAGLTNTYVTILAVSPNGAGGTNLFAVTDGGVFLSTNNGTSWTQVNTGLPPYISISALAVSGTNLFAVTEGGGVWRRPLSEMTSVPAEGGSNDLPQHFSLSQNYPNPFNPSTTISFSLPSRSFVSLKIFDALGREIANIVSEELSSGNYSRQWNATGLPSGVYFYRMQAGSYTETKKIILLK